MRRSPDPAPLFTCYSFWERLALEGGVEHLFDEAYAKIAGYGTASTPGIVIDGKVVHAGGLPKEADLKRWLQA